jgi:hypothetical protein
MTIQYSRFSFPNTPVDVCTIVGKYEHVLDAKRYKLKAGQTFRVVHAKTHYLNVLRTCTENNFRMQIRRQLVDLDANLYASNATPRVLSLSPDRCLVQSYIKACSMTSHTVCFICDSVERLADDYLGWIQSCVGCVEEPVQPTACIVLCGSSLEYSKSVLAHEFERSCTSTEERARTYALGSRCFSHTSVLYYPKLSNHRHHDPVNWQLLEKVERHALEISNGYLQSLGYYWREHSVHRLFSSSLDVFANPTDRCHFSVASALSVDLSATCPALSHQRAFFDAKRTLEGQDAVSEALVPLLGRYMAYHLLSYCPLLDIENFKMPPASSGSLFEFLFRLRYAHVAEQILAQVVGAQEITAPVLCSVETHMHAAIVEYLSAGERITPTHLTSLGRYQGLFQQQQGHQRLCAGCFFAYWDDVLPCRHGFCKSCTHNISLHWKQSGRIHMSHCPACLVSFPSPFRIRLQPPTAGGRVLSLDGGGVKGIIELEILQQLGSLVGGDLPVDKLFDMILGTSIGKFIHLKLPCRKG